MKLYKGLKLSGWWQLPPIFGVLARSPCPNLLAIGRGPGVHCVVQKREREELLRQKNPEGQKIPEGENPEPLITIPGSLYITDLSLTELVESRLQSHYCTGADPSTVKFLNVSVSTNQGLQGCAPRRRQLNAYSRGTVRAPGLVPDTTGGH